MVEQVRRVGIDSGGSGAFQFLLAVAATDQAHAKPTAMAKSLVKLAHALTRGPRAVAASTMARPMAATAAQIHGSSA
jgi:hypothetical protein